VAAEGKKQSWRNLNTVGKDSHKEITRVLIGGFGDGGRKGIDVGGHKSCTGDTIGGGLPGQKRAARTGKEREQKRADREGQKKSSRYSESGGM